MQAIKREWVKCSSRYYTWFQALCLGCVWVFLGFLNEKKPCKTIDVFLIFQCIFFPAVPFGKGEPNNHPNKFQTMETNFLEKGKSKINFEQSMLRNNSFLSAFLSAFSGTMAEPLKQFPPNGCPVPLSSFWKFSLCGSQFDMGVSVIPRQDVCSTFTWSDLYGWNFVNAFRICAFWMQLG